MGLRETIQNRTTNQSASWAIIAAVVAPLIAFFMENGFDVETAWSNLLFTFALVFMLLVFITNDKKQEHTNASQALTNPKILEQNLLRQASIMEGYVDAFRDAVKELHPLLEKANISEMVNTTGD